MKMNSIVVVAVAVIAVGAVGALAMSGAFGNSAGSEEGSTQSGVYTFEDAKGVKHSIETPISNVSVVHKYIPIYMKILGLEDEVAGLDTTYGMGFKSYFKNGFDIGTYSAPNGSVMVEHGSKYILSPVTMGLTNSGALKALGIEVIYLEVNNPEVMEENLEILCKLFGNTESIQNKYATYLSMYNECYDVAAGYDYSNTTNADFALYMASAGFYQTHASSAVKVIEKISGKSYTHVIDPDVRETVYFNQDPAITVEFDNNHGLDYLFVYTYENPSDNYGKFIASGNSLDLTQLTCVRDKHVYSLGPDMVNGALSCVASMLYGSAFLHDFDEGKSAELLDKAVNMVNNFNTTFGLNYNTENILVEVA